MNSPEGQQLPSSILHHTLMFKKIIFFIIEDVLNRKFDQKKAAKSKVLNEKHKKLKMFQRPNDLKTNWASDPRQKATTK